jgi:5-oxoprolinase (ATP-hydrolysing)
LRRIELPTLLYERVIEIDERIGAHGDVVRPLDLDAARAAFARLRREGIAALAIVLMHGYRYPQHEQALAAMRASWLRAGEREPRGEPAHEARVARRHHGGRCLSLADPAPLRGRGGARPRGGAAAVGGMSVGMSVVRGCSSCSPPADSPTRIASRQGRDPVGPAGGIVGAVEVSRLAGFDRIIGFDMGGTSTDVTHWAGEYERAFVTEVAGVRLRAPMMRIHTVAAGGGSICTFDGARFRVGPAVRGRRSRAGVVSARRPAHGHRLQRDGGQARSRAFPAACSAERRRAARRRRRARGSRARARGGRGDRHRAHARGDRRRLPQIAVENMANAIKHISVQRGYDVTEYTLCCFGGAAASTRASWPTRSA